MGKKRWLVVAVLLLLFPVMVFGLTLDDVIKLKELGIDEATIITKVKEPGMHFQLGAADLARLKKAGASDALIAAMGAVKTTQGPVSNVMFIFDCSGSMMEKTTDGQHKIVAAKKAFGDLVNKLSADLQVGIVAFGHKNPMRADKDGIEVLRKLGPFDKAEMALAIAKLTPRGRTPIAASLLVAAEQLLDKGGKGSIVLISDGKESAGGNPVEVARMLREKYGVDFGIYVVGFAVSDAERGQLERIAKAGGGDYFHATDAKSLAASFEKVAQVAVQAKPLEKKKDGGRQDLLLQKNGGHIVVASDAGWNSANDGNFRSYARGPAGQTGAFAFKREQIATIDSVAIHIPRANDENVKELEVLVSTESPTEGYTSLGVLKPLNVVMGDEGIQKFKFEPVKARYVQFKTVSSHGGGWVVIYELQVWGEIDKEQPAATAQKKATGQELLCRKNGGHMVVASDAGWKKVNDGELRSYARGPAGQEGVFAFKGEQVATVNAVGVFVPAATDENVKELEVLVSTESPTAGFKSAGMAKPLNALTGGDGFQVFTFSPVKAKYVKFKTLSPQVRGWVIIYELRVWGEIDKEQPAAIAQKKATGRELLCQKNGGHMVVASDAGWQKVSDGNTRSYVRGPAGQEGTFAFNGDRIATVNAVAVHVPGADKETVKELEVLVSTESPTAGFKSAGVAKPLNALMGGDGFQVFTFEPVKAKYVKFKTVSSHGGGWVAIHELQVWGEIDKDQPTSEAARGPTGRELLEQKNGGHLVLGSIPEWKNAIDGNPRSYCYMRPEGAQGVFGFRGDQIATINAVGIHIPSTGKDQVKEFEVLASTDDPLKGFTSLGVIKPVNALMGKDGFQIFVLKPVKAKYIKFVPLSSQGGGHVYFYELQVWGEIDAGQTASAQAAKAPTGRDLLSQRSGGHLVLGSIPEWKSVNDGNPGSYVYMKPEGAQGVFGFRGEGVATINAVGVLIPRTGKDNVKEFEILVSTTSPAEGFTSVGVVKTVNALMGKDGFQVFTFQPVKAKYVKFVPRSSHGGAWVYFYELRVWGTLD